MGEFWSMTDRGPKYIFWNDTYIYRLAAYLSHVWGRRFAAAEAFTSQPHNGGRWLTTPFQVKSQGDVVYARGINRFVYHRYVHQPWADDRYLPGMTMGRWGMHLDRTQTWWHLAPSLFSYQSRCQWMLQEGRFVADVLYWNGEEAPNMGKSRLGYPYPDDCRWNENIVHGRREFCISEIPQWVRDGRTSPTGRHTFTTFKHWTKDDELLPSGLIGPVVIRFGEVYTSVRGGRNTSAKFCTADP